jgi:hypothetical protein
LHVIIFYLVVCGLCPFSVSSLKVNRAIKSRRMRWEGRVACMGEMGSGYKISIGKPETKRPLGRPRRRWENNIFRMGLGKQGKKVWTG